MKADPDCKIDSDEHVCGDDPDCDTDPERRLLRLDACVHYTTGLQYCSDYILDPSLTYACPLRPVLQSALARN